MTTIRKKIMRKPYTPKKPENIPTKFYDPDGNPISSDQARAIVKKGGRVRTTPKKH